MVYALCLPLWFNAAVWGQCDAILSLALLAALLALLNDKPLTAGACIGWGLAVKLQAIVILPMAVVYGYRRFGAGALFRMTAMAGGVASVFILPMVVAGYGHAVRLSYTGAVGYYPFLTIDTFNPWALVLLFKIHMLHLSEIAARPDSVQWLGVVTPKQIGLAAFAAFTAFLMLGLYRRPTWYIAALSAGLTAYGFYMLPTQMHERYIIPAVALLTLCSCAGQSGGNKIYLAVMIPAFLNQVEAQIRGYHAYHPKAPLPLLKVLDALTLFGAVVNCMLFFWICIAYYKAAYTTKPRFYQSLRPLHTTQISD